MGKQQWLALAYCALLLQVAFVEAGLQACMLMWDLVVDRPEQQQKVLQMHASRAT